MKQSRFWAAVSAYFVLGIELAAQLVRVVINGHAAHPTRILAKSRHGGDGPLDLGPLGLKDSLSVRDQFQLVPGLMVLDLTEERIAKATIRNTQDEQARVLAERIAALQKSGLFEYVEPDYLVQADRVPTDAKFQDGTLWGLRNIGQNEGALGADIGAVEAWDLTTGSTNVIVAVIDSGIRYTHQDLARQMWRNPGEIPGNGLDDDGDGYKDNVFGINAIAGSGDPFDDEGHGTFVAGIIGAAANDGNPHVGVAWNVRLMACKFLDAESHGYISDAIRCINFAVQEGARILNNSWSYPIAPQALFDAISAARDLEVLFVAGAGNDGTSNDERPRYPSAYPIGNILSVAALDRDDRLASFSNYGAKTVHLDAPGVEIDSTGSASDTDYKSFSGTSAAAPHVSGVAALVLARFPEISVNELRERVLTGVVPVAGLKGKTVTGGRLNAINALEASPDGILEVGVSTPTGPPLIADSAAPIFVRVTDLVSVTNAVVSGESIGLPSLIFVNDGTPPDLVANDGTYSAMLEVPANGTNLNLRILVRAPGKADGSKIIDLPVLSHPPNDAFSKALGIGPLVTQVKGSNRGASKEPGEPDHAGQPGGRSVWWSWTAPINAVVDFKTEGSRFDTVLAVYTGNAASGLSKVASDDDGGDDNSS